MSKSTGHNIGAAIEWSPNGAQAYESVTRRRSSGATISDLGLSLNGHTTVLAVSRRTAFVKPTHVPNAGESEIRQVLQMQLGQLFPLAPGEMAYDLWLTSAVGPEGRLAVVCGVRSDALRSLTSQAAQAGVKAAKVVPAGLGAALLARSLGLKDCTVVERGPEGMSIDIVVGGELRWSRVAACAESNIEFQTEIDRTHAMAGIPFTQVVAAGGLTLPAPALSTNQSTIEMLASPQAQNIAVHLELPEAVAQKRERRDAARMRHAVLLAIVACVAWAKVGFDMSSTSAERAKAEETWTKRVSSEKALLSAATTNSANASETNKALLRALKPAQSFGDVMTVVSNDMPESAWLSGATMERGKTVVLRGTAMTSEAVAAYVKKLTAEKRFRDVRLIFANNGLIDTTPVVQFSVSLHAIGNLPVAETDKDKRKR